MKLFDPDPTQRWLFCMTHPDDEISICAWIRRLTRLGVPVHMSWTHSNAIREREGRTAAHLLGVPQERLHFFAATDGSACDEMAELLPQFLDLMDRVQPTRVCCGAFEQGHIDHDTTNFLVSQAYGGLILEIPFYHTYVTRLQTLNRFSDPRGQEILHLDLDEQRFKKVVARQYPSQNIWNVLLWYEISQNARLRPMTLAHTERMRMKGDTNYMRPNHPSLLARKVSRSDTWRRWRRAVRAFRRHQRRESM